MRPDLGPNAATGPCPRADDDRRYRNAAAKILDRNEDSCGGPSQFLLVLKEM